MATIDPNQFADIADRPESDNLPHVEHQSIRKKRRRPKPNMQLQMTSMIDIIFLLLIYFVVTASFTENEGVLTTKLPEGDAAPPSQTLDIDQTLEIELNSGNGYDVEVVVDGIVLDHIDLMAGELDSLIDLPDDPSSNGFFPPDTPVIIKPGGRVRWQYTVHALNAAIRSGFTNVRFAKAS